MESVVEIPLNGESRFDLWRKTSGALLAPLAFTLVWHFTQGVLSFEGHRLAAVLAAVAVLWVTEPIPLPATAVAGAVLCILLGVADAKTVLEPFADPIIFLFIGSFMLARAMALHRLDRRIALSFLSLPGVGTNPAGILVGLGTVTALISMWVSNTATAAMMLPIATGILVCVQRMQPESCSLNRAWPFASGMMLMVAYSASLGGIATPVGTPPNLIGIGLIRSLAGVEISFFKWMALGLPVLLLMGAVLLILVTVFNPVGKIEAGACLPEYVDTERKRLGKWSPGEVNTLASFLLAVILWVLPGVLGIFLPHTHWVSRFFQTQLPESVVALVAAGCLFLLPIDLRQWRFTLSWEEAVQIDWGTILLFGGGLSLGTLMFKTGVAATLGQGLISVTGASSLWALTALATALGIVLSEMTSNTATANMLIPVIIALSQAANVNPVPPALGTCLGASFGFMLPVSTPPNAIAYGSGLVPIQKMVCVGLMLDVLGFIVIVVGLRFLCPWLHLC